jgi:hypothetical protein
VQLLRLLVQAVATKLEVGEGAGAHRGRLGKGWLRGRLGRVPECPHATAACRCRCSTPPARRLCTRRGRLVRGALVRREAAEGAAVWDRGVREWEEMRVPNPNSGIYMEPW